VLTVRTWAAFLLAVLQIHEPLDDPPGAQQGRGISHEIAVDKMLKQVQEELDANQPIHCL
jgi:hypothetical protein